MRTRALVAVALAAAATAVVGGAALERSVPPRAEPVRAGGTAFSGAWLCPHGGGRRGWTVTLSLANPGPQSVAIRVTSLGRGGPTAPEELSVAPGSTVEVQAPADGRARSSLVEYFGGWVAAAWTAVAGGEDSGAAAEPCLPDAARSWILPDGTTERGEDTFLVVMNPFAGVAVFTVELVTEGRRIGPTDWSDFVLPAGRSVALRVNTKVLGERTVVAEIRVSRGRVAAATLGVSELGGIRSAVGVPGARGAAILPGGADTGRTDLVVVNPSRGPVEYDASLLGSESLSVVLGLDDEFVAPGSAQTQTIGTEGPSTVWVEAVSGEGLAAARRTFGIRGDQGATGGAQQPAPAWVVFPAAGSLTVPPRLFLANPEGVPAVVTLTVLGAGGPVPEPLTLEVRAGRTVLVPPEFTAISPRSAVLAVAESGTFVPAAASYPREGLGYTVAVGAPIPPTWVPS